MRIPRADLDRVLEANPIVPLVEQYVRLRRAGHEHTGLCPFHSEKTGSFIVSQARGWRCFGCSLHGNAIDFVMRMERLPFLDAVRLLADRGGVSLSDKPNSNKEAYVAMVAAEAAHYWTTVRRCYSDREARKVSMRNAAANYLRSATSEDTWWQWYRLYRTYARSAARWDRIITRLDSRTRGDLLSRYIALRQKKPAVALSYRRHLEEERAWSRDWQAFLVGL